jgi:hypothetical protein
MLRIYGPAVFTMTGYVSAMRAALDRAVVALVTYRHDILRI